MHLQLPAIQCGTNEPAYKFPHLPISREYFGQLLYSFDPKMNAELNLNLTPIFPILVLFSLCAGFLFVCFRLSLQNLAYFGLRSVDPMERLIADKFNIKIFGMRVSIQGIIYFRPNKKPIRSQCKHTNQYFEANTFFCWLIQYENG